MSYRPLRQSIWKLLWHTSHVHHHADDVTLQLPTTTQSCDFFFFGFFFSRLTLEMWSYCTMKNEIKRLSRGVPTLCGCVYFHAEPIPPPRGAAPSATLDGKRRSSRRIFNSRPCFPNPPARSEHLVLRIASILKFPPKCQSQFRH